MKLLDEQQMNEWAYNECKSGNDTPEIRKLITIGHFAYLYCKNVKDRKEMWSKIDEGWTGYYYCKDVKNRPQISKYVNNWNSIKEKK